MDTANLALGLCNILVAILFIAISIPLYFCKIPMNNIYGFRFKKSFESDQNWFKINSYGGKQMAIWSIPIVLVGILTFFIPVRENIVLATIIACAPLIIIVPVCMSYNYSKNL